MKILAILCVRNEEAHLSRSLRDLAAEGVDVHLIDNGSTDSSLEIARSFLGRGVVAVDTLPWTGSFSLSEQLDKKNAIIGARTEYDWVIHIDADEWLCPPEGRGSLREQIIAADASGFNCINFHEIVFVPLAGDDFVGTDYTTMMNHYYFFQPSYPRLIRIWKRCDNLYWGNSGGHNLSGNIRLFPRDLFLRHYIALSYTYASKKYVGRTFADVDLKRGWHGNRLNITQDMLHVKHFSPIFRMTDTKKNEFDLSRPVTKHFWEW